MNLIQIVSANLVGILNFFVDSQSEPYHSLRIENMLNLVPKIYLRHY